MSSKRELNKLKEVKGGSIMVGHERVALKGWASYVHTDDGNTSLIFEFPEDAARVEDAMKRNGTAVRRGNLGTVD